MGTPVVGVERIVCAAVVAVPSGRRVVLLAWGVRKGATPNELAAFADLA
jgi:UDP-N-acetylmuramoylalanine-D-glutamate ligase